MTIEKFSTLTLKVWFATGIALFSGQPAQADKAGEALLQKCIAAESRLSSLQSSATMKRSIGGRQSVRNAKMMLQKPNKARVEFRDSKGLLNTLIVSNGKSLSILIIDKEGKRYVTLPTDPTGYNFAAVITPIGGGVESIFFFNPKTALKIVDDKSPKITGSQVIGGLKCRVLDCKSGKGTIYRIYIGPDNRLRGGSLIDKGGTLETQLIKAEYDTKLPASTFAWTPPKDAKSISLSEFIGEKKQK